MRVLNRCGYFINRQVQYSRFLLFTHRMYFFVFSCMSQEKQGSSKNKTNKSTKVTIIFVRTICHKSDMFQFILMTFRDLTNIKKSI